MGEVGRGEIPVGADHDGQVGGTHAQPAYAQGEREEHGGGMPEGERQGAQRGQHRSGGGGGAGPGRSARGWWPLLSREPLTDRTLEGIVDDVFLPLVTQGGLDTAEARTPGGAGLDVRAGTYRVCCAGTPREIGSSSVDGVPAAATAAPVRVASISRTFVS